MKNALITTAALAATITFSSAATIFGGGDLTVATNWDNGLPGSGNDGTINVNGSYTGLNQLDYWTATSGAVISVGSGAVLNLNNDFASSRAVWHINDATIICSDDFFVGTTGAVINLNAGSAVTAVDDWEVNNNAARIVVNGGTHSSGTGTGGNVGAQGGASKIGCGIDFLGGTVTAGNFRFQLNSVSSVGGSAILASAGAGTTFSDDAGEIDFLSGWTGSWEVGSFGAGDWETRLTSASNGFLLDGTAIDATSFANNFEVSGDGTTLTLVPEPSSTALLGLGGLALILRRRK